MARRVRHFNIPTNETTEEKQMEEVKEQVVTLESNSPIEVSNANISEQITVESPIPNTNIVEEIKINQPVEPVLPIIEPIKPPIVEPIIEPIKPPIVEQVIIKTPTVKNIPATNITESMSNLMLLDDFKSYLLKENLSVVKAFLVCLSSNSKLEDVREINTENIINNMEAVYENGKFRTKDKLNIIFNRYKFKTEDYIIQTKSRYVYFTWVSVDSNNKVKYIKTSPWKIYSIQQTTNISFN